MHIANVEIDWHTPCAAGVARYGLYMATQGNGKSIATYPEKRLVGAYRRIQKGGVKCPEDMPSCRELMLMSQCFLEDQRDAARAVLAGYMDEGSLLFLSWAYRDWVKEGRPFARYNDIRVAT